MRISLEFGDARARMIKAGVAPEDLPPQAEVPPHLRWVWRAWHRLSQDRPYIGGGMGSPVPGRIPWTVVNKWTEFHSIPRDRAQYLDKMLGHMDSVFLKDWQMRSKIKPEQDKTSRWGKHDGVR